MKRKTIIRLVLLMVAVVLLGLSHWSPFHHTTTVMIKFERDVPDLAPYSASSAMSGYDPYFTRVNMMSADLNGARHLKAD